jgi:hypothetical protein
VADYSESVTAAEEFFCVDEDDESENRKGSVSDVSVGQEALLDALCTNTPHPCGGVSPPTIEVCNRHQQAQAHREMARWKRIVDKSLMSKF